MPTSADAAGALPATDYDLFFAHDSSDLTPSDQAALTAYAQKYLQSAATDQIQVTAYASVEGPDDHNQKLSEARARSVLTYLAGQGVPKEKISASGQGETAAFSKDDLRQNRRATIAPQLASSGGGTQPVSSPPPAPPNLNLSPKDLQNLDVSTVSRDDVEQVLTEFFTKLQAAQGGQSLRITDRVRQAGQAVGQGLPSADTKIKTILSNDRENTQPATLARRIAGCLPDRIPRANFDNLLKLAPKELQGTEPQSLSGALAKLLGKEVAAAVSVLPKQFQDAVKKGIADAIASGIVAAVDKAMSDSPLDQQTKNAIHSAVEAAIKQKESGPPMDRQQGGAGSPDAHPQPPPATPPPGGTAPGEQIQKTPSINTPDTPPAQPKPP